jgi:hypothetical protein
MLRCLRSRRYHSVLRSVVLGHRPRSGPLLIVHRKFHKQCEVIEGTVWANGAGGVGCRSGQRIFARVVEMKAVCLG